MRRALWLLFLCAPLPAAASPSVEEVLGRPELRGATVAVLAVRHADGKVIEERNADLLLVPASATKVATAVETLQEIGPDATLSTRLGGTSQSSDIELRGGSDPSLTSADLDAMARAVQLPRAIGRLLVGAPPDPARTLGPGWAWDDAPEAWSAEPSPLTVDRGCVRLQVMPGNPGEAPVVTVPPAFQLENRALTAGSEDTLGLVRVPGRSGTVLLGTVGAPVELVVSAPEPALLAGEVLRSALARRGIACGNVTYGTLGESFQPLAEHSSAPVSALLSDALARSDNLYMENFFRLLHSPQASLPFPAGSYRQVDGCGLSRYNRFSARQMASLVHGLVAVLPQSGAGTLKGRLAGMGSRVRAKTGTMSSVSALVGTIDADSSSEIDFALIENGYLGPSAPIKADEDALVAALAKRGGFPSLLR